MDPGACKLRGRVSLRTRELENVPISIPHHFQSTVLKLPGITGTLWNSNGERTMRVSIANSDLFYERCRCYSLWDCIFITESTTFNEEQLSQKYQLNLLLVTCNVQCNNYYVCATKRHIREVECFWLLDTENVLRETWIGTIVACFLSGDRITLKGSNIWLDQVEYGTTNEESVDRVWLKCLSTRLGGFGQRLIAAFKVGFARIDCTVNMIVMLALI